MARNLKYIKVICFHCGDSFKKEKKRYDEALRKNWKQFCSHKCLALNRTKSKIVVCKNCLKKFKKKNTCIKSSPNNFCSKTCAAKYNNHNRFVSDETKRKISKKLKGRKITGDKLTALRNRSQVKRAFKIKHAVKIKCKICKKKFSTYACPSKRRKTCSYLCEVKAKVLIRPYQNGSKRITPYFNPFENKKILLDSSWEVKIANLLCKYNIAWIRPDPLSWVDSKNKNHLYFPDFFLPYYNVYLDPKNPYCMDRDKEKMNYFKKRIILVYGKLSIIVNYIEKINSRRDRI